MLVSLQSSLVAASIDGFASIQLSTNTNTLFRRKVALLLNSPSFSC
jgi:hypothetical protein